MSEIYEVERNKSGAYEVHSRREPRECRLIARVWDADLAEKIKNSLNSEKHYPYLVAGHTG